MLMLRRLRILMSVGIVYFIRTDRSQLNVVQEAWGAPLDRGMILLQLCRWKFSHKETL